MYLKQMKQKPVDFFQFSKWPILSPKHVDLALRALAKYRTAISRSEHRIFDRCDKDKMILSHCDTRSARFFLRCEVREARGRSDCEASDTRIARIFFRCEVREARDRSENAMNARKICDKCEENTR